MSRVMLLGDAILDQYCYADADRVNPENAKTPLYRVYDVVRREGGALNVAKNLSALGVQVIYNPILPPCYKIRIVVNEKVVVARIDIDRVGEEEGLRNVDVEKIKAALPICDALVLSDYNKGALPKYLTEWVIAKANELKIPVFVDPPAISDFSRYNGATCIKCNEKEAGALSTTTVSATIVTKGRGTTVWNNTHSYMPPAINAVDVTGAGDTFFAALIHKVLQDKPWEEAIIFANKAAALTVEKFGCYAPTEAEIEARFH
jgi:bifunctional ADP-heptose synthase (sugar kinase/adenylyltransferase)